MFLLFEYPLVDMRSFLQEPNGRLDRPAWPIAETGKDFIRSCGVVRARPRGGVGQWAGEDLYGDVSSAVKFQNDLRRFAIQVGGAQGQLSCTFRRFFSDGVVARLEIGLRFGIKPKDRCRDGLPTLDLIRQILEMNLSVSSSDMRRPTVKLAAVGSAFAKHFLRSSTAHDFPTDRLKSWWVTPAAPALLIECESSMLLPSNARRVLFRNHASPALFHSWIQMGNHRISSWFMISKNVDPVAVRNLRIHVSRLHSERESLRCVLTKIFAGAIAVEKRTPASDAIQHYINNTLRVLEKPSRFGFDQSIMLETAHHAFDFAMEGETASLGWARRQVAERLRNFIERNRSATTIIYDIKGNLMNTSIQMGNVNVTGGNLTVATAHNIENSFNTVMSSATSEDLKMHLRKLSELVADLATVLPEKTAEQVSLDLKSFVQEATSGEPRKSWLDLSSQGLIDAATTVKDMASPIAAAVKSVLSILSL